MTGWNVKALVLAVTGTGLAVTVGACGGESGSSTGAPLGSNATTAALESFTPAEETNAPEEGIVWGTHVHMMPMRDAASRPTEELKSAAGKTLTYYGGPVISNVKVVEVLYGAGTYLPNLTGGATPTMASFYGQMVTNSYFTSLSQYDTPTQNIGAGTFDKTVQITPAAKRDGATITDAQVQKELNAQITSGVLPAPDANTLYMIHFPQGKAITHAGSKSCVQFCAYHGTFQRNGQDVYYGILPDMTKGGCVSGCGTSTAFNNQTAVSSHELAEAVTDAAVGLATTVGAPLAWYNTANGEIGDICNGQDRTINGTDGHTYTVQKLWSNAANACQ